jgi:predicted DNA-binding transcriptional regulator AlpA
VSRPRGAHLKVGARAGRAPPAPGSTHGRTDLDHLPPLIDVPTAAAVLGIGRTLAYDLVRTDRFPTPVLRIGKLIRIPTAGLRRLLDADPAALTPGTETA